MQERSKWAASGAAECVWGRAGRRAARRARSPGRGMQRQPRRWRAQQGSGGGGAPACPPAGAARSWCSAAYRTRPEGVAWDVEGRGGVGRRVGGGVGPGRWVGSALACRRSRRRPVPGAGHPSLSTAAAAPQRSWRLSHVGLQVAAREGRRTRGPTQALHDRCKPVTTATGRGDRQQKSPGHQQPKSHFLHAQPTLAAPRRPADQAARQHRHPCPWACRLRPQF